MTITNPLQHTLVWVVLQAIEEDQALLRSPAKQALLKAHGQYYPSLQPLVDSVLFMDMLGTIGEASPKADKARFYLLYKKLLYRVIAHADIIMASCHDAGHEDLYLNFGPTIVIVDNATEAAETEAFIPLLMYQATQLRVLLGNRHDVRLPVEEPWSPGLVQRHRSFFERMALNGVPVHELKTQYFHPNDTPRRRYSEQIENKLAATIVNDLKDRVSLLDRPCPCGAGYAFGKCCNKDNELPSTKRRSTSTFPLRFRSQFDPPRQLLHRRARTISPLKRIPEVKSPFP